MRAVAHLKHRRLLAHCRSQGRRSRRHRRRSRTCLSRRRTQRGADHHNPHPAATTTVSPIASVAAVSYSSPPPLLQFQSLGNVEVPTTSDGGFAVAIGELGVAVNWSSRDGVAGPQIDVVGFDGQTRNIANVDGSTILAYGPGDIAYLTRQGTTLDDFAVVAVPLSGDNAGTSVATQPANINEFLEYPPLSFGHGLDGVIHRRQYLAGTAVAPYVEYRWPAHHARHRTGNVRVRRRSGPRVLGGVITSTNGMSWTLAVEAAPDRADTYTGISPPAAGSDRPWGVRHPHWPQREPRNRLR